MRALAVDGRKVDGLGACPHVRCDVGKGNFENQCGRLPMNVTAGIERGHKGRIAGEMGKQSQFDLGIVGRKEH